MNHVIHPSRESLIISIARVALFGLAQEALLYVPWTTIHENRNLVFCCQTVQTIVDQRSRFSPDVGRWRSERVGSND